MQRGTFRKALVVATLAATIGTCAQPTFGATSAGVPTHQNRQFSGSEPRSGGGGGVSLPASFPAAVPLPKGRLMGVGTGPGRWSVLLRVAGSAKAAQHSAIRFYVKHGFKKDSSSRVHGKGYRIDMAAENRDHSATSSNLTLVVHRLS